MKTLSFVVFILSVFTCLNAAPLRDMPIEFTQPDGSTYKCYMSGDEFYHRAHDARGYTIIKNFATGWYVYAEQRGKELLPGSYLPGKDDPEALGLTPYLTIDKAIIAQRADSFQKARSARNGRSPTTGTINNICVFVRFADQGEYIDPLSNYDNMFNSLSGVSMKGYFQEDSGNQLTVDTSFYPAAMGGIVRSYQDPHPQAYYLDNYSGTNPLGYTTWDEGYYRLHLMLTAAVMQIAPTVPPYINIDADNDGSVDNISFICMGGPSAWYEALWPHNFVLDYYHMNPTFPTYNVPLVYINGSQADEYDFELRDVIDVGLICHEFSHTLGFPDLYHYWTATTTFPCDMWDLMDGAYGTPRHHLAYTKWKYGGWFSTIPVLGGPGNYTLNAIDSNPFSCYWMPITANEYYVFEYRRQNGLYESALPASGLIVYRVRTDINGNDNGPPDEVYVYRPGVSTGNPNGWTAGAPYAMNLGHSAINNFTDPAPFLSSGASGNLILHHVSNSGGATIDFTIGTTPPNIWTGSASNVWNNPGNWTLGMVPNQFQDVIIGAVMASFWPQVSTAAICSGMRIETNPMNPPQILINPPGTLHTGGSFELFGVVTMLGNVTVDTDFTIRSGGQFVTLTTGSPLQVAVRGDCLFEQGSVFGFPIGFGTLMLDSWAAPVAYIRNHSTQVVLDNVTISKSPGTVRFSSDSTQPILINGNFTIAAGSTCYLESPMDTDVMGNITVTPGAHLYAMAGQLRCIGTSSQTIDFTATDSHFHDLRIMNTVNLNSGIMIAGNIYLDSGTLFPGANLISLKGNWINSFGPPAFMKANSRVIFCGTTDQFIQTPLPAPPMADFYILEINKPLALVINTPGQMVQCDIYDCNSGTLRVTDGVFNALSLADNSIFGNFECHAPGVLNLTNNSGSVDLEASLGIWGGTVNIYGGTSDSQWPGFNGGGITMTSGLLEFHNVGVLVDNMAQTFVENISGGFIRVNGGFNIQRSDFSPSGGTIVFVGSTTSTASCTPGSNFYNVTVSMTQPPGRSSNSLESANMEPNQYREVILSTSSSLTISGALVIHAGSIMHINHNCEVLQDTDIVGELLVNNAELEVGEGVNLNGGALEIDNSGYVKYGFGGMNHIITSINGSIEIGDGTLESNRNLQLAPLSAINIDNPNGHIICPGFEAMHSGTFTPSMGSLELRGYPDASTESLLLAMGNSAPNLLVSTPGVISLASDITVNGNLNIIQGQLDVSENNYSIYLAGNWDDLQNPDGFIERNGEVHFNGTGTRQIYSHGTSQSFWKLCIDSSTLQLASDVSCQSITVVAIGTLSVQHNLLINSGDSAATAMITNGAVSLCSTSHISTYGIITIAGGGSLICSGTAADYAQMSGIAGALWKMEVLNGGSISAVYTEFTDLRNEGILVCEGATVDLLADFDGCKFFQGGTGATYLTISNSQSLEIENIIFISALGVLYNISKTNNLGTIVVTSSSGDFAGPLYENDPYSLVSWTGYYPNLTPSNLLISETNPIIGDVISVELTVTNNSPYHIDSFFDVWLQIYPVTNPDQIHTYVIYGLAGNANLTLTFSGLTSSITDTWVISALVDPDNDIQESDEMDNLLPGTDTITWQAMPEIQELTLQKTGDNTARLSWSYPVWASRFKIYYDDNPFGSFANYLDWTIDSFFDISLSPQRRFYRVVAERDM